MDNLERATALIDFFSELRLYHQEGIASEETIRKVSDEIANLLIPSNDTCSTCGSDELEYIEVRCANLPEHKEIIADCNDCVLKSTGETDIKELAIELDKLSRKNKPPHFFK